MKKVCLRGYTDLNLGDDLFVKIICNRYPESVFYLIGSKTNKNKYCELAPNIRYKAYDTGIVRFLCGLWRLLAKAINTFSRRRQLFDGTTDQLVFDWFSRLSDINVFITGSGFMNAAEELESLPHKYEDEQRYYRRHPILLGCNFGPFAHNEYLNMYRKLFSQAADICFRDSYSESLFPMLEQVRSEADVVFNYPHKKNVTGFSEGSYMLISVANLKKDSDEAEQSYYQYVLAMRRLIDYRNEKRKKTIFVGFSIAQHDGDTIGEITKDIFNTELNAIFCYPDCSIQKVMELFEKAECVVATRYHAMILGLLHRKPTCTICYNEKTAHALNDIDGLAPYVTLDELDSLKPEEIEDCKMYKISDERLDELISSAEGQFKVLDDVMSKK